MTRDAERWLVWYRYSWDGPLTERTENIVGSESAAYDRVNQLLSTEAATTKFGYRKLESWENPTC